MSLNWYKQLSKLNNDDNLTMTAILAIKDSMDISNRIKRKNLLAKSVIEIHEK